MPSFLEKIILFATRATVGTIACVLVGTVFVYFVLFGSSKKPSVIENSTSREIKKDVQDVHTQNKATTAPNTTSKKALIKEETVKTDKASEPSVKELAKPAPFLAQYESTLAMVLRDAANYKPAPIAKREITPKNIEKSREINIKQLAAVTGIASVAASAAIAIEKTVKPKAAEPVLAAFEATTATTALEAQNFVAAMPKAPKPFLAAYEATTAYTAMEASAHIAAMPKAPKPFLAAYEATTASTSLAASDFVAALPKAPKPFLAAYEATTASTSLEAQQYVAALPKAPKPFLAAYEATTASTSLVAQQFVSAMPKAPKPFLAAYEATTANTSLVAQQFVAAMPKAPKPSLAAYEATTASTSLEAQEFVKSMPKASKPFLAAYEATTAIASLEAQQFIASMPKTPKPFLAAFEATAAATSLAASEFVATLPKAPKPFLAAFEATTAISALEASKFVTSMPKAPKPFLAAFEATTASTELEASRSIKKIVSESDYCEATAESLKNAQSNSDESNPVLAAYEATTAHCAEAAQKYAAEVVASQDYSASLKIYQEKQISNCPETASSSNNLTQFELTTASTISASRNYINDLTSYDEYTTALNTASAKLEKVLPTVATNLASLEATTAYQLLQHQQHQLHAESDSDIEVEIEDNVLSSPSAISSVSSTTSSEIGAASRGIEAKKSLEIDTAVDNTNKHQFDVSWDQMYNTNNDKKATLIESPKSAAPFMSTVDCTYYPNCTNKNCKFVHPGQENNPKPKRAATMDAAYKKPWTKAERIERQSQTHFPTWKSRCVHWPYCTNNHCKYSHPIKECRMGEQCTFMERCMFLHPSDFMEPVKKRHTPKKAQTLPQVPTEAPASTPV